MATAKKKTTTKNRTLRWRRIKLGWVAAALEASSSAIDPKKLPVLVGTAATLDAAMTATVLRALASAKTDASLVVALRRDTTAESRDALGLELLDVWRNKEFHGRLGWIMDAIGALGGDRSIMALAAHVATWPSDGDTGRKRAIGAAPVLAHANTNTAILELIGLRQSAVVPTVLEATISALQHVVRARHTTLSELFDVVTPTPSTFDPNVGRARSRTLWQDVHRRLRRSLRAAPSQRRRHPRGPRRGARVEGHRGATPRRGEGTDLPPRA